MATLLCPQAMRLTASAPSTARMLPLRFTAAARAPYSSSVAPTALSRSRSTIHQSRPATPNCLAVSHFASRKAPSIGRFSSATSSAAPVADALTWNRFFDLRRKRRYVNLATSIVSAAVAVGFAAPIIAQQDIDSWGAQISGMDPMIVLGITTFAVAGGGWLCGPFFGNSLFRLWASRRGWAIPIAEKEKSFYARVKRYRGDPAFSSPQSPVPDYYGEKIGSVKDYRRWLKDQRAFNLKRNKNPI